jgi:pyruvate formate lyase activating enzyme
VSAPFDPNLVGQVFNIQRYSTKDGPGVRTTVFLKGCPMHCFWCQNPESQSIKPVLFYKQDSCTSCGRCVGVCKQEANRFKDGHLVLDRSLCVACGACVEACPNKARTLEGKPMTVQDVMDVVVRDRRLYKNSGGGMTVSGGACEMQANFTVNLLAAAHDENIRTAVEIEGFYPWSVTGRIVELCDFVYFDLKNMDSEAHKRGTGAPNETILENARRIVETGTPVIFRTPLIPTFNDDRDSIRAIILFVRDELGLDPMEHLELLPYNNLGENKYDKMDFKGFHPRFARQSDEHLEDLETLKRNLSLHQSA